MTEFEPLSPPSGGLADAFRVARRRRLRNLSAFSAGGVTLAVGLLLTLSPANRFLLVQQPAPVAPAAPGLPTPGSSATPTQPVMHADRAPSGATGQAPAPGQPQGVAPTAGPPSVSAPVEPGYASASITRNDTGVPVPDPRCNVDEAGQAQSSPICPSASARAAEGGFTLYADLCSTSASPITLHYATSQEIDFVVLRGQRELWRWSSSHEAQRSPHTLSLTPGHCRGWSNAWTAVDDSGRPLPQGAYRLVAHFAAAEAADHPTWETDFTIS